MAEHPSITRAREIAWATEWSGDMRVNMTRVVGAARVLGKAFDDAVLDIERLEGERGEALGRANRYADEANKAEAELKQLLDEVSRLRMKCGPDEMTEGEYHTLAKLEEDNERLREAVRVRGGCRMLSDGDQCDCSLCVKDKEIERLEAELADSFTLCERQAQLLTEAVNALRGEPPELVAWSHHDVGELARSAADGIERLAAELAEERARRLETVAMCEQLQAEAKEAKETLMWRAEEIARLRRELRTEANHETDGMR